MDANIKYKKKNLNKAYFKILSNSMSFDCFYLAPSGRQSPPDLFLGIPGLGPEGVRGGAEQSWLDSGPVEGQRPVASGESLAFAALAVGTQGCPWP